MKSTIFLLLAAGTAVTASPLETRQSPIVATVDVGGDNGPPKQLASGILYGTPDTQKQIPDRFYTGPKLNYFRAGGAQLFNVGQRGWIWNEYEARFNSTRSNYWTARRYNGRFQLLPHDIWGTDTANSSTLWPGDNGDWRDYEKFLDRLIADIKKNGMLPGLEMDIWNEPDLPTFWQRSLEQYLELWRRSYIKFRAGLPTMPIVGPSYSAPPTTLTNWWTTYMNFITQNNVVPDTYTWHTLYGAHDPRNDLQNNVATMQDFFKAPTNAPARPFNINEYINNGDERTNAANAWNIARLERYNTPGLRANWLSGLELHDFLAELVYRPDANSEYQPNGAWWMYRYYAQNMTGVRLPTTGSPDRVLDVFATRGAGGTVRILTGVHAASGYWEVEVRNLTALGFPPSGPLTIQTWGFDDVGLRGVSTGPSNRGKYTHTYSGGVLRFPIFQTEQDKNTAWAFEFKKP